MSSPSVTAAFRNVKPLPPMLPLFIDEGTTEQRTMRAANAFKSRYAKLPAKVVISDQTDDGSRCNWFETVVTHTDPKMKSQAGMVYAIGAEPQQIAEEYDAWLEAAAEAWLAEEEERAEVYA